MDLSKKKKKKKTQFTTAKLKKKSSKLHHVENSKTREKKGFIKVSQLTITASVENVPFANFPFFILEFLKMLMILHRQIISSRSR